MEERLPPKDLELELARQQEYTKANWRKRWPMKTAAIASLVYSK
jgi:hypothetical protein